MVGKKKSTENATNKKNENTPDKKKGLLSNAASGLSKLGLSAINSIGKHIQTKSIQSRSVNVPAASAEDVENVIKNYGVALVNRLNGRLATTGHVFTEKILHGIGSVIEKNPQTVDTILSPVIQNIAQTFSQRLAGDAFDLLFYQLLKDEFTLFTDSINELSKKKIRESADNKKPLKMDYMIDQDFILGSIDIFTRKLRNEIYPTPSTSSQSIEARVIGGNSKYFMKKRRLHTSNKTSRKSNKIGKMHRKTLRT